MELTFGERKENQESYQESCTWFIGGASQSFPGDAFFSQGGVHSKRDPVYYCSLMQMCVQGTHFHLVYEPPCGPDLAPCLGPRQTWEKMTDRGQIRSHNDHE